jgi:hypothetical protein
MLIGDLNMSLRLRNGPQRLTLARLLPANRSAERGQRIQVNRRVGN